MTISLLPFYLLMLLACAPLENQQSPLTGILAIATGGRHTCALTAAGAVECWGGNQFGQLGDDPASTRSTPASVAGLTRDVQAIAAGGHHTCALTTASRVLCWGHNASGQLGNGTESDKSLPMDVVGLTDGVRAIAAGGRHTCVVTTVGGVKCWGDNDSGQLGDGTELQTSRPTDVKGLTSGISAIAAGGNHTCALTASGGVKCWGDNDDGQLGNGRTEDSSVPVDVVGLRGGVRAITAGGYHTCALTLVGEVLCWGDNSEGQLGNGREVTKTGLLPVIGLARGVRAIAAGSGTVRESELFVNAHTCALTVASGVTCWGNNDDGQVGNGTTVDENRPVEVVGLASGVGAIATGGHHTCALQLTGTVQCWGDNSQGQLGNGTLADSLLPMDVMGGPAGPISYPFSLRHRMY